MNLFLFLLPLSLLGEGTRPADEGVESASRARRRIYKRYRGHFGKEYNKEQKRRGYRLFWTYLDRLLVRGVAAERQIFFDEVEKGAPIPVRDPRLRRSCAATSALHAWADLSEEHFIATQLVAPPFSPADVRRGFATLREIHPEARELLDWMEATGPISVSAAGGGRLLAAGDGGRPRRWRRQFARLFRAFDGLMGPPPPAVPTSCGPRLAQRLLGEKKRRMVSLAYTQLFGVRARLYVNYTPYLTQFKPQLGCQICHIFAATDAVTMSYAIAHNITKVLPFELSVQELVDCLPGNACLHGGTPDSVFAYINEHGIASAARYPFTAVKGPHCLYFARRYRLKIVPIPIAKDVLTAIAVLQTNVLILPVHASFGMEKLYTGELFDGADCNPFSATRTHMVLVYGYQIKTWPYYFLVKNSWRELWGRLGHFKLFIHSLEPGELVRCALHASLAYQAQVYLAA